MYDARFGACSAGSRRLCSCFFEDYILFVLAIELLRGITTSSVVPYPYVREVSMRCNFDPVRKLHSFSAAVEPVSCLSWWQKTMLCIGSSGEEQAMLARALICRVWRVVERSCGLLAWFQTLQLLILDQ